MATSKAVQPLVQTRVQFWVDVPAQLNSKAIDGMVSMAASRMRFLLGVEYRKQIQQRVQQRVAAEALRKLESC